ncbi:hypothetical protein FHG87_005300 [Trinorchestia longiramus]|nr:hypothetical protein FHG87_005300 [Trinorchestia longiramus]
MRDCVSEYACVRDCVSEYACMRDCVSEYACVRDCVSEYDCVRDCVSEYACVHDSPKTDKSTAMAAPGVMVGMLILVVVVAATGRYDMLTLMRYKLTTAVVNRTENVLSPCDCRKMCVEDINCTAVTIVNTRKEAVVKCWFTETETPSSSLQWGGPIYETIYKERKPKKFFWSSMETKIEDYNIFNDLCSADGGKPGTILTMGDYEYVREKVMPLIPDNKGRFIPLESVVTNVTLKRKHTTWINLSIPLEDSHPLHRSYKTGGLDKLCHKIKEKDDEIEVEQVSCTDDETKVLCYKYE